MPTTSPFTGSDFKLETVALVRASTVRVRFTFDPLAANPAGVNDALNISLYSASGPEANAITSASTVPDDPQAIDLTFFAPLVVGTWTLTASAAIQTAGARPLQAPLALQFPVTFLSQLEGVPMGATNDSAESVIRKHLGPAFKGRAWNALIAALAVSDRLNWDNAKKAFNQLFKSTASGIYLDRKAGDDGLARPPAIGMPDDLFRKFAIKLTANKLTQESLLEVLEVFYGPDSVRAHIDTQLAAPFGLAQGKTLEFVVDERDTVIVIFQPEDANQIGQAGSAEVAAAITRAFRANKSKGFAVAFTDTSTGRAKVRVYSPSLGLGSSIRVRGGTAQRALRFEALVYTPPSTTTPATVVWNVSIPEAGRARYTISGSLGVDLNPLVPGDYVLISGPTFQAQNRGSFRLEAVSVRIESGVLVQSFDVLNDAATAQTTVPLAALDDMLFFKSVKKTIHAVDNRTVVVAQNKPAELDIVIPATTQAVGRTALSGAYGKLGAALTILSMVRNTSGVVTVTTTGLPAGFGTTSKVLIDEAWGLPDAPTLIAGNEGSGLTDASLATIWSPIRPQVQQGTIHHTLTKLQNGKVLVAGGQWYDSGSSAFVTVNACEQFGITATSTLAGGQKQFTYNWFAASPMTNTRSYHAATLLNDGTVLATGGWSGTATRALTEIYTPDGTVGAWTAGPSMIAGRALHTSNLLTNGTVLITGGVTTPRDASSSCEIYDPSTGAFTSTGSMNEARAEHEAVSYSTNQAAVFGGRTMAQGHTLDATTLALWRFDETSGSLATDSGPNGYTLTGVNGPGIISGKIGNGRSFSSSYMTLSSTSPLAVSQLKLSWTAQAWVKGTLGTIVSYGLNDETLAGNRLIDIRFTTTTLTWGWEYGSGTDVQGVATISGAWVTGDWNHIAVVKTPNAGIPTNYDVLVYVNGTLIQTFTNQLNSAGGTNGNWFVGISPENVTTSFSIDDLKISTRALGAGEVYDSYIRGLPEVFRNTGSTYGYNLPSIEVFSGGSWSKKGNMAWARTGHKATLLPDGRVLITGGYGYRTTSGSPALSRIAEAELWDPATGKCSSVGSMRVGRAWHTATLLADRNQVVVEGGTASVDLESEIFDIATLTWRRSPINGPALIDSSDRKAVLMNEGAIFVHGGYDTVNPESLLYIPASDFVSLGGLTGIFSVLSAGGSSFTYSTDFKGLTTNTGSVAIYPIAAQSSGTIPGPLVFDHDNGAAVTSIETTLTQDVSAGRQYTTLNVANAAQFPDAEGYLAIGYGTSSSVFPIRYLGRYSATALILDYQFKFPTTNLVGARVTYLSQKAVFDPANPEKLGAFYATASSAGRVAAQKAIADTTAAGIKVSTSIVYPGDRGLGGEGLGVTGTRISDKVAVWGGDDLDAELGIAHGDE